MELFSIRIQRTFQLVSTIRFREKLRMKKEKYAAMEHEIRSEVENMRENQYNTFQQYNRL